MANSSTLPPLNVTVPPPVATIGNATERPPLTCQREYFQSNNKSAPFVAGYSGIPNNIALNLCVWLILTAVFLLIRKMTVYDKEERTVNLSENGLLARLQVRFSWVPVLFTLSDQELTVKCGPDALIYLIFQRYLLCFLGFVMVLCIGVVLPINYHGELVYTSTTEDLSPRSFGRITIANVDASSPLLWVHCLLGALFLIVALVVMRRFTSLYIIPRYKSQVSSTLLITNVPCSRTNKSALFEYFSTNYPEYPVESINYVYDVKEVMGLALARNQVHRIHQEAEGRFANTGTREEFRPIVCGCCCCCCRCQKCNKVDAIDYYGAQEKKLSGKYQRSLNLTLGKPIDMAFVTFTKHSSSAKIYGQYNSLFTLR